MENVDFEKYEDKEFFLGIHDKLVQMEILEPQDAVQEAKISSVTIEITNKCKLRCKYCCVNAGDEDDYEFSTVQLKDILKKSVE